MRGNKFDAVRLLFNLMWTHCICSALVIPVSKMKGHNFASCLVSNSTTPCQTVEYALRSLKEKQNQNETVFILSIEDQVYILDKRVCISQTNKARSVYIIKSRFLSSRAVLRCDEKSAGIDIGNKSDGDQKSTNIHFQDLEFQECGPRWAAVVLIWNSVHITFTRCEFKHNRQAGINAFDSGVTIEYCSFVNNTSNGSNSTEAYKEGINSAGGGAGFLYNEAKNLSLLVKHSHFESNTAVTNDSVNFIAPSSNVSHFSTCGGGIIVVFRGKAKDCQVAVENSVFSNNSATYGGGFYFADSNMAVRNKLTVINSNFSSNYAGQTGGGLIFSQWDNSSNLNVVFKHCMVSENRARRGAGMNVFLMNYDIKENDSTLRFHTVTFSNNYGSASTAIRFTTALPYGSTVDVTPEFINCTVKEHNMSNFVHTSPFTSQRVNMKFKGNNVFRENYGGGAAVFQDCVVFVQGKLTFANNSGSNGGALFVRSSQIKLFPDSELAFVGNKASGLGGAVFVWEHLMDEFIHVNNPDCFLAYSDPLLPPSKWKTNVSFIENSSKFKGSAIYISSLQRCVWNEDPPYHDAQKALRWSSNFIYRNNSLIWDGGVEALTGSKYDIATDTKKYRSALGVHSTVKLSPGEHYPLNLQAIDELGHEVTTIIFASEGDQVNRSSKILLEDVLHVLSPNKTVPFSFRQPEALYNETKESKLIVKRKIQFVDPYSTLINDYSFELELETCHPGFVFSKDTQQCVCDKNNVKAIERCENGSTVYLKKGYWANTTNGKLVTYFCPFKYCGCDPKRGLPGCLFDRQKTDRQCAKNREGWLCGKCTANTSVGLRRSHCIKCENSGWILGVVIPIVIGLCVLVIWLNPGISSELRGPLFFFQVLPYIFDPTSQFGGHVFWVAELFNFGGPLIYLFTTCIVKELDNLYAIAFGYMTPLLALFVFLLAYCLSANYCLKFKFRSRSMLQSFWLLLLVIYNYLVETSFLILFCPKVGGKHVFFYDGTMECFHGDHLPMGIIAVLVLVVMVIPPPIVVVLLTTGFWRVDPQYVSTLTDSLRPECRWWWSVDMSRRVLVVATYAFVPNWEDKKILFIVVCVVLLTLHSNFQPYSKRRANIAESLQLMVLCMLAIMQKVDNDSVKFYVCLALLITVSLHTLVVFLYKSARFFHKRFKCCAWAQKAIVGRNGFKELEDTQTDSATNNIDYERRRNILDTIFGR